MIPIRDENPRRFAPVMTWSLIGVNVVIYFFEASLPEESLRRLIESFGFVPAQLTDAAATPRSVVTLFTSMFLHGSFLHLAGNMWTLWIFGDNVEDRMGSARYLGFYLLCGLAAGGVHWATSMESTIPTVGASGAISGVMGAYMVLFPRSRLIMLLPVLFLPYFFQIPAWVYLGVWFVGQAASGTVTLGQESVGGVAFWAHIGGFVAGVLLFRLFLLPKGEYRPFQPDEDLPNAAWRRPGHPRYRRP